MRKYTGKYTGIVVDAPWHEPGGNGKGSDDHYSTIRTTDGIVDAIACSPMWQPAADCMLFCWTTMTSIAHGLELLQRLGFKYKTHGVWVKVKREHGTLILGEPEPREILSMGIGQYLRGTHEVFLIGTRGRGFAVRSDARDIPSVLFAPVPRRDADGQKLHSSKPDAFFDLVRRRVNGRLLEMFARAPRDGWDVHGAEIDDRRIVATLLPDAGEHG